MMACPPDRISEMIDLHQKLELEIQLQSLNITNLGPEESIAALQHLRQAAKKTESVKEKLKVRVPCAQN